MAADEHDSTNTATATVTATTLNQPPPTGSGSGSSPTTQHSQHSTQQQPKPLPLALLLDVQHLDDYLLRLVLAKLEPVLTSYRSSGSISSGNDSDTASKSQSSWLWPALQLVTLWVTRGQTPAVRLLGLRVQVHDDDDDDDKDTNVRGHGTDRSSTHETRNYAYAKARCIGLLRYSILGILVPFLYQKLKEWKATVELQLQTQESLLEEHEQQQLARQRRLQVARLLIRTVDTMLPGVKLVLLLTCWSSGFGFGLPQHHKQQQQQQKQQQHVPPHNVAARLCQWKYHAAAANNNNNNNNNVKQQQHQRLHVDFAHRRWLYECLFATSRIWLTGLLLVAPAWQSDVQDYLVSPLARLVRRSRNQLAATAAAATAVVFSNNNKTKTARRDTTTQIPQSQSCPICRRTDPITVPVQGNCASDSDQCRQQTYCYACLYRAAVRSRKVYCPTCGGIVTRCRFVS
jgi:hypothetical protein